MFCVHQINEETHQIDDGMHQIDDEIHQIIDEMDQIDVVYAKTMSDAEDSSSDETGLTGDVTIENSTGEMVCDLISFYNQK